MSLKVSKGFLSNNESKHGEHWVDRSMNQHEKVPRREDIFFIEHLRGQTTFLISETWTVMGLACISGLSEWQDGICGASDIHVCCWHWHNLFHGRRCVL